MGLTLKSGARLYFMGIGGTGMAAVAGLMQEAGFHVQGSDKGVYPPMSDMLEQLGIAVATPYSAANLDYDTIDLIVVANALSRGNPEVEFMLQHKLPHTSFPALMGATILADKMPIVVAGTHGKTTTTTIVAHILEQLGEQPGFLIGGLPRNFDRSFRVGSGQFFVIEGDEYDTAFFDKESKFLHYRPEYLILNNLEFDHADIFASLAEIEAMFFKLIALVKDKSKIIANVSDAGIANLLAKAGITSQVTCVGTSAGTAASHVPIRLMAAEASSRGWTATIHSEHFGVMSIPTTLTGDHNMANLTQVVALLDRVARDQGKAWTASQLVTAASSFGGVARRLDLLGEVNGIKVYEDFAHHPTAIATVIAGFRKSHPGTRVVVAFEPVNATGRRSILLHDFAKALSSADDVWLGQCPVDERIPASERMDTRQLAAAIGTHGRAFDSNEDLLKHAVQELQRDSAILFMSPGSFSGIQHQLIRKLTQQSAKTVDPKETAHI